MEPVGKIEPQSWMSATDTRAVLAALSAEGAMPRFVGGCVRDALLGRPVKDIDIATTDPPERVVALLERAGLKAVPTGLAHGTVTAISRGHPFEVTSLRVDVETYGRQAHLERLEREKMDIHFAQGKMALGRFVCLKPAW